jgi:C4-type zinc ribbon protein
MDETVCALTDLLGIDDQLSAQEGRMDGFALALQGRRSTLRQTIPQPFLAAYDALGQAGRRPVVVAVRGAHCGGCYLRLPPQLESAIRRRQSLFLCPHCRRLLYASRQLKDEQSSSESKHAATRQAVPARLARNEPKAPSRRGRGGNARGPRNSTPATKRREKSGATIARPAAVDLAGR